METSRKFVSHFAAAAHFAATAHFAAAFAAAHFAAAFPAAARRRRTLWVAGSPPRVQVRQPSNFSH